MTRVRVYYVNKCCCCCFGFVFGFFTLEGHIVHYIVIYALFY